jgi:hypothetical protein
MPWHLDNDNPKCSGWAVVKDSDGSIAGCHKTKAKAVAQLAALNINVKEEPKQGLFRMVPATLARAETTNDGNTLVGFAAVTDTWAEIESIREGTFRERIQPGAFKKTVTENADRIKVLFNHGFDPSVGNKPLGKPAVIEERAGGLWTETPLDDTSYNADLRASLRSGAIDGMSFAFDVIDEEWNEDRSERTIREVKLYEFGPVTWPAYESTSAGIRSKGVYGTQTAGAAPPKPPGRITAVDAADSPDDEGRDTTDVHKVRSEEVDAFTRTLIAYFEKGRRLEEAKPRRWYEK